MSAGPPGTFVVSIDLEMSWGAVHHGAHQPTRTDDDERPLIGRLLSLLDSHGISATWATVGHLFLDRCGPFGSVKHPEIIRPVYDWFSGDWFDMDPADGVETSPTWYAPDVIDRIRGCRTHQEIACHSFSHMIAGDPGCSAEVFTSELVASRKVAEASGIDLTSFVYPRNSIGHIRVLEEAGFSAFRGPRPNPFSGRPIWQQRWLRIIDMVKPNRTSSVHPRVVGSMVDVPQTYLFDPASSTADANVEIVHESMLP